MSILATRTHSFAKRALAVLVLAVLIAMWVGVMPARPNGIPHTYWVSATGGSDSNDGTSSAAPFKTITHALSVASTGSTLSIMPGTYNAASGETFPLVLHGCSLRSTAGTTTTIIDAGGTAQVMSADNPLEGLEIRGLTIRGGGGTGPGAGIMLFGSSTASGWPRIIDNYFDSNSASTFNGGAVNIYSNGPETLAPRIEGNRFNANAAGPGAGSGGALYLGSYVSPTVVGNTFIGNQAYNGGAIFLHSLHAESAELRGNTFQGNSASGYGGGLHYQGSTNSTLVVSANGFFDNDAMLAGAMFLAGDTGGLISVRGNDAGGNSASDGGGFGWLEAGHVISTNNAVGGNHAGFRGAAWYLNGGTFQARNDTIVENQGAPSAVDAHDSAVVDLANCILWNPALTSDVEHADSITYSCLHDTAAATKGNTLGAGVIFADPKFAAPGSHTIDLAATSPCIDAANNAVAPSADFYGTLRPIDGDGNGVAKADIGAFERKTDTVLTFLAPSTSAYASATVTGTLKTKAGVGLVGRPVTIEYSYDNWATVAGSKTAVTAVAGAYSASFGPTRKTYYRARYAGDSTRLASNQVSRVVLPRVYLTRPKAASPMRYRKSYSVSGYLKPRHTSGTKPVRIMLYRRKGGHYVLQKKHYHATVKNYSTYSKYSVRIKLPYRGKWRLKAYHPTDSLNASTKSGYRYVTVK